MWKQTGVSMRIMQDSQKLDEPNGLPILRTIL